MMLTLPYPPSANRYFRIFNGRAVTSGEAKAYKLEVALRAKCKGVRPREGEVKVQLDFYRPARRGDLDNRIKILLDALQGVAFHNDSQVVEIHARRFEGKGEARVEVTIN